MISMVGFGRQQVPCYLSKYLSKFLAFKCYFCHVFVVCSFNTWMKLSAEYWSQSSWCNYTFQIFSRCSFPFGSYCREITSDIQKQANTHIRWKTIHCLSNRAPPPTLTTSIPFNNKLTTTIKDIANCFTNNSQNGQTYKTNRSINRETHKIQGYNITLTTAMVQEARKQSSLNNKNSQGPDKLIIMHLKHIGPLGLALFTSMF